MVKLTDIQAQIEALQKQADVIRSKDFDTTVAEIRQLMAAFGITVKDLLAAPKKGGRKPAASAKTKDTSPKKTKPSSKVEAKYRGPGGETWSGRGLMPKWLASLIEQGRAKEEFAIAAPQTPQGAGD